ncbi:hypothetical protein LJC63_02595 [Ruminococcaceae bacterium OttesenSCG-928-L11]|nr:hypothetical protein [Ruminococcaceae bacterium OttesenSCG-928-L11]
MRQTTTRIIQILLIALVCMAVALPAAAASRHNTVAGLFNVDKGDKDSYVRNFDVDDEEDDVERDLDSYEELEVIQRSAKASLTVTSNQTISNIVQVTIPKGYTLTIDKGATLTVAGELIVEGTLVNNGAIVVGTKKGQDDSEIPDDDDEKKDKFITLRYLHNKGTITNNGTISILCGTLRNGDSAVLNNSGTVTIANAERDTTGFLNYARRFQGKVTYGTVNNTGSFTVANTDGTGLHIFGGSRFQNSGTVTVAGSKATVKGTVQGNAVKHSK